MTKQKFWTLVAVMLVTFISGYCLGHKGEFEAGFDVGKKFGYEICKNKYEPITNRELEIRE
jgi:hypothetical protein